MFFRQILHEDLGCASYLIGSKGEAAVVDPKWEIDEYLEAAADHGLKIERILETHNHADHLSGRGRLAAATGARIHISADAGVDYDHEPLRDGEAIEVGAARIRGLATPGHRPEHIAYLVEDPERGDEAWLLLSGDSLFVGDLARPDLAVEPEEGARGLFATLARYRELPDFVEVWPGHIGGSLCGGSSMSEKPQSTIGFERRFNPYLRIEAEEELVARLTGEAQPQPPNFERIVELNRGPLISESTSLPALAPDRALELVDAGAILLDVREPHEFDGAHVPGSVNVTAVKAGVGTRAAWIADPDSQVLVLAGGEEEARSAALLLEAVGFRELAGYVGGGIEAWRGAGLDLDSLPAIDAETLARELEAGAVVLLDVREQEEWEAGHVEGSIHVPYHELREGAPDAIVRAPKPVAVACSGGFRSALAASVLRRQGVESLRHVAVGGVADLAGHGIELSS
jgi:hydroxyacylglutathione hydrolase